VQLDAECLERHRIVAHNKNSLHGRAFDILRTRVLHKMSDNGWRTLGVVSAEPAAGKTVVAINLAMSIAQLPEQTVLLVDFDLRAPSVLKYLGVQHSPSLNDLLQGNCEFQDMLLYPQMPGLVVAAPHQSVPNSAELLASSVTARFVDEARNRYPDRTVIIDLPPLFNGDDAIAVLPQIDCVLVVVANGVSSRTDIKEILRLLPGSELVGTVLNKAQNDRETYPEEKS
jgi:capsular exopolysaccharide synthesis family protein